MIQGITTVATFLAIIFLPWPIAALIALIGSLKEPLLPLAAGLTADVLYFVPQEGALPLFSILGAVATIVAFFARSRLTTV